MPSPAVEQPTADSQVKVAGEKRSRSEQAEDELYEEYEQEFSSKKRRLDNEEASISSSTSASGLSDTDKKRSEIRKETDTRKTATASKNPTAEDYISASSSTNFDPATFNDSDIDDAFEDPKMENELSATNAAETNLTLYSPSAPDPSALSSSNNDNSNQEPPIGEILPMSSFAYLFNTNIAPGYPPFFEPFEYINDWPSEQEISDSIARWDT
ncbi:MAG: hypothetical protein Q9173_002613, partial [Seirophora scorigena]